MEGSKYLFELPAREVDLRRVRRSPTRSNSTARVTGTSRYWYVTILNGTIDENETVTPGANPVTEGAVSQSASGLRPHHSTSNAAIARL